MPDLPDINSPREVAKPIIDRIFNREDSETYHESLIDEANRKDAKWIASLAVLGVGAHVFGRLTHRNIFANLLDYAGRGASFLGNLNPRKVRGIVPETSDMLYRRLGIHPDAGGDVLIRGFGGARGESFELVQDLASALNMVYDTRNTVYSEELEVLLKKHFSSLPRSDKGARPLQYLHHDLERITVKEIFEKNSAFVKELTTTNVPARDGVGRTNVLSIGIVEEALRRKWITDDTLLDANVFKTIGKNTAQRVVDLRLKNPRTLLTTISEVGVDMAGVVKGVASFMGSAGNIAHLGIDKATKTPRVFIGGNVYELGQRGVIKVAEKQSLGNVGDLRFVPSVLREAGQRGTLDVYKLPLSENPTLSDKIQDTIGIGPKYHDRKGGFIQGYVRGIVKGAKGIGSGEAVFYGRDFRYKDQSLLRSIISREYPEAMMTDSGREVVRGKFAGDRIINPDRLNFLERIKAYMGLNPDVALVKAGSAVKANLTQSDLYLKDSYTGLKNLENFLHIKNKSYSPPVSVSLSGQAEYVKRAEKYAATASPQSKIYDFSNWMAIRLNKLFSSTLLGIGFRPEASLAGNWAKVATIPLLYMSATEAIKYSDYVAEELTGVSPVEKAATLYTKARVIQQKLREMTGIADMSAFVEKNLLPGVSIGAIGTAASIGLGIHRLEKFGSFKRAALLPAALYAAIGGPDVGQPSVDLKDTYSGEKGVPVRKSRWWMLGYQPFAGDKIDHYAPSWYQKLMQKPYMSNVYGSEDEYWAHGSKLPTPHNLFGLNWILDPYWLEKKNYYTRPYPYTGGMGEDIPVIGPILADSLGAIVKPRRKMHNQAEEYLVARSNVSTRGVSPQAAMLLGIPDLPKALIDVNRPDVFKDRVEKYLNVGLEPLGIWKFVLEYFGLKFDDEVKTSDASNMSSKARAFYSMDLGGAFGETEMIRRFLMSDYGNPFKINQQYNPIRNKQPEWLPGSNSIFDNDKDFYVDFHTGDAYTKMPGGEYRLPGMGYEKTHKLHGGSVYSDVDKYLILSDVAPHSQAYWYYKGKVSRVPLSDQWKKRIETVNKERDKRVEKYEFRTPQENAMYLNENPLIKTVRNSWVGFYENVLSELPIIGSKFFPHKDAVEHYKKFQVEGESFANWNKPYETIVRPTINDLAGEDPITATIKGGVVGWLATSSGLGGRYLNPVSLMHALGPVKSASLGALGGFGLSMHRISETGTVQGSFVPEHVTKERELREYLDNLKYAKYSNLQAIAEAQGQTDLAKDFGKVARKTKAFGIAEYETTGRLNSYKLSLDTTERMYFEQFIVQPKEKREEILQIVPEHMKRILSTIYSNEASKSITSKSVLENTKESVDEYFRHHALPNKSWIGWHPGVSDTTVAIKMIKAGVGTESDSVHRFNYYPVQEKEVDDRFDYVNVPFTSIHDITEATRRKQIASIFSPMDAAYFTRSSFGTGPEINIIKANFIDYRLDETLQYYQEAFR